MTEAKTQGIEREISGTYLAIRQAVLGWNWAEVEGQFLSFVERHAAAIPSWFADEFLYAGMQLWAADRQGDVLRHFANFFDRALGREACWDPADAAPFATVGEALA